MTAETTLLADRDPRRPHRRAQPVGDARAGRGRRRHRLARDAAQRGGHQPQGDPRGRRRDRPAGRRRDPAGRRARPGRTRRGRSSSGCRRTARSAARAIVKPEGEAMHRCPNRACPSRGLETLINWVGAAADIDGVGEQFVRRLWAEGLVRSMPDLYRLTAEQLLELDGYGEISASNAIAAIEPRRRTMPFRRVLFGLNIPDVGWVTAQNLARHFGDVDRSGRREPRGARRVRGDRPGARRGDRRVVRRRGQPRADRGAARRSGCTSQADEGDRPVEGPLSGQPVRGHGHARAASRARRPRRRSRRSARRSRTASRRRRPP